MIRSTNSRFVSRTTRPPLFGHIPLREPGPVLGNPVQQSKFQLACCRKSYESTSTYPIKEPMPCMINICQHVAVHMSLEGCRVPFRVGINLSSSSPCARIRCSTVSSIDRRQARSPCVKKTTTSWRRRRRRILRDMSATSGARSSPDTLHDCNFVMDKLRCIRMHRTNSYNMCLFQTATSLPTM